MNEHSNDAKTEKTDSNDDNLPRGADEIAVNFIQEPNDMLNDTFELETKNLQPSNLF